MADLSKKAELGVEGEEIMRQLFGDEFADLIEDKFEGSTDEYQIFEEIFYGTSGEDAKPVNTHAKPSITANPGGLTSSYSMKDSSLKPYHTAKMNFKETSTFESFQESSSSCVGSSAHNALAKPVNLSFAKHLDLENQDPEHISYPNSTTDLVCLPSASVGLDVHAKDHFCEPVSSTLPSDDAKNGPEHGSPDTSNELLLSKTSEFISDIAIGSDQALVPHGAINKSERGILSTCNLIHPVNTDATGFLNGGSVINCTHTVQDMETGRVVVEGKSVTSPVSQESVAPVILATSVSLASKETSSEIICVQQSTEPTDDVGASVKVKRPLKRELPCQLESYAHRLLIDAGWKIENRQRNDRPKSAHFFINTEEGLISKSLSVAWKACGERLLVSAVDSEQDEHGREWWDFDSFWRDMKDTMASIDKEAHNQESSLSLLRRWQLLDPFMATMWIDRRLKPLRQGMGVKAMKSKAMILHKNGETASAENGADKNDGEVADDGNCSCCENSSKKFNRSLGRCIGGSTHNVKCLHMGSKSPDIQLEGSNRSSESTSIHEDSGFLCSASLENNDLHAVKETLISGADDNCAHTKSERQELACPANQHDGSTLSNQGNDLICNSVYQVSSSLPQENSNVTGEMVGSETKKSKRKRTAAMPGESAAKKARKKSKKISEIGVTELNDKGMGTKLPDGSYREEFVPSRDGKTEEQLNHSCFQKETSLTLGMSSECLYQVELLQKQINSVHQSPRLEDMHTPKKSKISEQHVKSEAKAARQSGKKKANAIISLENEHRNTLSEEGIQHHASAKGECKGKRLSSDGASSMSSKKGKAAPECSMVCDQPAILADYGNVPKESVGKDSSDGVLGTIVPPDQQSSQKLANTDRFPEVNKKKGQKKFQKCRINDDDLLIAAIIKRKDFGQCGKQFPSKAGATQLKALRKLKSQKGSCRLLPRTLKKGGNSNVDGRRITLATRSVLCWLIEMGSLSFKDVVQYRNPKNNAVIKDGWVTREGILCKCCTEIFSLSDFKAHAGLKQQRASLNLFVQSGKPYTLCQLQAWSAEFKKRKNDLQVAGSDEQDENDDTCGLCGDGGDLICCDNCPSTYHQTCLSTQELPEGNWYCPNCICVICKDLVSGKETSSSLAALECAQCEHKYHSACIEEKVTCNGEIGSSTWFCGESCREVYLGLRTRVGVVNCIDDGYSWTVLRCSHDDQKVCSAQKIALMADCNTKLAIALNLMEECFQPMVDPRTGIDMIPHVLYNLGSSFARLNYQGFYAVVLEKGDQLISVASIRLHGAKVAEMPLIATCSGHRRQGMCRRLLNAIEKMLISFKVKILVLSAIPSLVETWTSGFGFKPVGDEEKEELTDVNLMLFPGTTLLTKSLLEASVAQDSVENIDFCSGGQQSHIFGNLTESARTITGHQPVEDLRSYVDAKSLAPSVSGYQVEQVSIQQGARVITSSANYVLPSWQDEHGVVNNAESCLSITTSNINKMSQIFSTDHLVACEKPVANTSIVVHACSGMFVSTATDKELPISSMYTAHNLTIREMKESTLQNIPIQTECNAAGAMNVERITSIGGVEVAKQTLVDDLHDKDDAVLSHEQVIKNSHTAITHEEVSKAIRSTKTNAAAITNPGYHTFQNAYKLAERSVVDMMNYQKGVSVSGGEVERKSPLPPSEQNNGACVSDELAVQNTDFDVSDMNELSVERVNTGEVPRDDSFSTSKYQSDFVGKHAVAKRCTSESMEA